jgi:large subunit ribosomal protein L9
MKVILLQDVEKLGEQGQVVNVKDGFGRNYLIPKGLARLATPGAIRMQEELQRQAARRISAQKGSAEEAARQLGEEEIVVYARVGEDNRIFGTVTAQQIAVELNKKGFDLDRRKIDLDDDIRLVGVYSATVKLHPEVSAKVKIRVEPATETESVS